MVRRRNLSTVEVPRSLTNAVEAAASGSRSTKLQRLEARHLTDSLKQLSRTPGKGGTTMSFGDAVSGTVRQERRKKVGCPDQLYVLSWGFLSMPCMRFQLTNVQPCDCMGFCPVLCSSVAILPRETTYSVLSNTVKRENVQRA